MFFFLEKDSFEANSRGNASTTAGPQHQGGVIAEHAAIRRPYRGIQIKNDTYAVLSVRTPDGRPIQLASSSAFSGASTDSNIGAVEEYSDFILQQVTDQRMEKQQIIETFGDSFVYFFGERPRIITISGQLMNTDDFNWRAQFWYNYEKYLRGSKLVQQNARCYLAYDTIVIEGYPLSASAVDDADNPYQVSFQMTILLTNYHEFSQIGSMQFPGVKGKDFGVLNQELDERRATFVSTSYQVRRHNVSSATSAQIPKTNSVLAAMRAGVDAWNSAAAWLGDQLHTAQSLLAGRSMRVPIGAASYLELLSQGEVAPGSGSVRTTATSGIMDPENGIFIPGHTLLIAGPSKFAPSWTSSVVKEDGGVGSSRGMIYENIDEYPLRDGAVSSLESLLPPDKYEAYMSRIRMRQEMMTAFQKSLITYNELTAQGSVLGTIADVVTAVRAGFGMLMTAANVIRDPMTAITGALGATPQDITRIGKGLKNGAFIPGVSFFVGGAARKTWEGWSEDVKNRYSGSDEDGKESGVANIGDVYKGSEYKSKLTAAGATAAGATEVSEDVGYELAYGDSDYTALIDQQAAVDAETVAAEGDLPASVDRTEPNADKTASTLSEVYGDTDSSSFGSTSESPETLDAVYGSSGTIQKTQPSGAERAAMLQEVYNGSAPTTDTNTSGITASDADSAPIDPVV